MSKTLHWRVHTENLLEEILINPHMSRLRIPLNIFRDLLVQVGERSAEINDPQLNALMLRLTIYSAAVPTSIDYNPNLLVIV